MTSSVIKGRIVRSDLYAYDGISERVNRKDHTGGTLSSLPVNDYVDVLQAYGSGVNYTRDTISKCTTAIGSRNRTLTFSVGTWTIDDDLTIGSNFVCRVPSGCVFDVASGKTLTFSGPVITDYQTWTSGSGTVTVNGTRYHSVKHDHTKQWTMTDSNGTVLHQFGS